MSFDWFKSVEVAEVSAVIDSPAARHVFGKMNALRRQVLRVAGGDPAPQFVKSLRNQFAIVIVALRAVHDVADVHVNPKGRPIHRSDKL